MSSEHDITADQFELALKRLSALPPQALAEQSKKLRAGEARSYFVETADGEISLKLVTRAAYADVGVTWVPGEGPNSAAIYRRFKDRFRLLHRPMTRVGDRAEPQIDRETEYVKRLSRRGQARFRQQLINLDPQCALTACKVVDALEAAHIQPVADSGSFSVENGLLLRADLHRLFDLNLLAINPRTGEVWLARHCRAAYAGLTKAKIKESFLRARQAAFKDRWSNRIK